MKGVVRGKCRMWLQSECWTSAEECKKFQLCLGEIAHDRKSPHLERDEGPRDCPSNSHTYKLLTAYRETLKQPTRVSHHGITTEQQVFPWRLFHLFYTKDMGLPLSFFTFLLSHEPCSRKNYLLHHYMTSAISYTVQPLGRQELKYYLL